MFIFECSTVLATSTVEKSFLYTYSSLPKTPLDKNITPCTKTCEQCEAAPCKRLRNQPGYLIVSRRFRPPDAELDQEKRINKSEEGRSHQTITPRTTLGITRITPSI
ncbi:hypothetical protein T10_4527 [Trichinella papuae]|uniref:Uncharacterized protein n=1 Tax=Trichinella papuae TaxID=268474 RepID=A0A0V1M014_9BILA|nr:hypothetical protein T10_4527 [Trichinella papuae]